MRLLHVDGDEDALLAALLFEAAGRRRGGHAHPPRRARRPTSATELLCDLVGVRANRRHRPGRGFEALRYRFEVVSDYGAFRDLQRHRMLTVQWQRLTPHLGAGVPEEVQAAGCGDLYRHALDVSRGEWERLAGEGREREALYALCLGYRIRYVLDLNAREAMQLIELRSGREGHPGYRAVAHEMHRLIGPGPPGGGRCDDARRHRGRAAARAHPQRDAHAGEDRRPQRALTAHDSPAPRASRALNGQSTLGPISVDIRAKNPVVTGVLHLTHHPRLSNSCNCVCTLG